MRRILTFIVLLSFFLMPSLSACTGGEEPLETDFGKMMTYVPADFLVEHDIWFGNPAYARQVYNAEDITSVEALLALPDDKRSKAGRAFTSSLAPAFIGNHMQIVPLVGWDGFNIDRSIYHETPPPWCFNVNEGRFDTESISEKLLEQGYEETTYGDYTCFQQNDDWQTSFGSDISSRMNSKLNRVAVTDKLLITAPATEILNGILDTMDGTLSSLADDMGCRALSEELGDVFYAVLIPRERVMQIGPKQTQGPFDIDGAAGWEPLHEWETTALGYRDDGTDQYLVISLYYPEKADAEADAANLVTRLNDYVFFTWGSEDQKAMGGLFADAYETGEPVVTSHRDGATLTVSCRKLDDEKVMATSLLFFAEARDLLFLVPDPEPYLAD